jgi:hypothetical protein
VPYLKSRAAVAIWIDATEQQGGRKLQSMLERLGFRIEAGAKCEDGFILSARRLEWSQTAQAA